MRAPTSLATNLLQLVIRVAHGRGLVVGPGERIEDAPLRLRIEQRLCFVLPVQVDEVTADLAQLSRASPRSPLIHARARPVAA